MPHVIEEATTARSKCRGCGEKIAARTLRFGEVVENPFAEGETTLWFHVDCGAYKRPEAFLDAVAARTEPLPEGDRLIAAAEAGRDHPKLARADAAGRAPSGRAECRQCHAPIGKGDWRLGLVFFEDGRFNAAGFLHLPCAPAYFESPDILPRVKRFSPGLSEAELAEVAAGLAAAPASTTSAQG